MAKAPAKQEMEKKKKKRRRFIVIFWFLVGLAIVSPTILVYLVSIGTFGALPATEILEDPDSPLATEVVSGDGSVIGKYYDANRSAIVYDELSPNLVNALVATEDVRYLDHAGVDFRGLGRVFFKTVLLRQSNSGGGSTISQQLAKNLFPRKKLNKFQLLIRKLKEWVIATRLEKLYTKEEMLAMYFNTVEFNNGAYGIKSASKIYFNKLPSELNVNEAATLVGMLKAPTYYNPVSNPDNSLGRRNTVLYQMNKYDRLSHAEYEKFKKEPIALNFKVESHSIGLGTYFREYLRQWLQNWANNRPDGNKIDIYRDGIKVYTTIDSRMQAYAEEAAFDHLKDMQDLLFKQYKNGMLDAKDAVDRAIRNTPRYRILAKNDVSEEVILKELNKKKKMRVYTYRGEKDTFISSVDSIKYYMTFLQPGFMAMDPTTGHVKVWVGGVDYKYFQYDHITSQRQVGSTFKPIVYATAIMNGYSPCQRVPNTPVVFEDYENWSPKNSDDKYGGEMSLKRGMAGSVNTITAWVMKQVGVHPVVDLAQRMGITSHLEPVPSLCLGTADISVMEMVGAFNTFNNKGLYTQPVFVTRIEDKNGNVIENFLPRTEVALDEKKNYVMLEMLKGVTNCSLYGTACRLRYRYDLRGPMGGKTGTTQNNSDGWFMGIIPQLTGGIWVGAEDRSIHFTNMNYGQGAAMALPIWANFLKKVYADKSLGFDPMKDWEKPVGDLGTVIDCDQYKEENTNPGEMSIEEKGLIDQF